VEEEVVVFIMQEVAEQVVTELLFQEELKLH
jgi:hypothetical protein